jgi:Tfp pilus assembly protein PilX
MRRVRDPVREAGDRALGERGLALVVAMMVLLILSVLASVLLISVHTETRAARGLRDSAPLGVAPDGAAQAFEQIRDRAVEAAIDPRSAGRPFLAPGETARGCGADTTAPAAGRSSIRWIECSTSGHGADVVRIPHRTDAARSVIYRSDDTTR